MVNILLIFIWSANSKSDGQVSYTMNYEESLLHLIIIKVELRILKTSGVLNIISKLNLK